MANPYRSLGYTAILDATEEGDFLQIKKNGVIVCGEVAVSVFPDGPGAPARMIVKRFRPNELRKVDVTDDFDGRDEKLGRRKLD